MLSFHTDRVGNFSLTEWLEQDVHIYIFVFYYIKIGYIKTRLFCYFKSICFTFLSNFKFYIVILNYNLSQNLILNYNIQTEMDFFNLKNCFEV